MNKPFEGLILFQILVTLKDIKKLVIKKKVEINLTFFLNFKKNFEDLEIILFQHLTIKTQNISDNKYLKFTK